VVEDETIPASPLDKIPKPKVRAEQVQPFTQSKSKRCSKPRALRRVLGGRSHRAVFVHTGVRLRNCADCGCATLISQPSRFGPGQRQQAPSGLFFQRDGKVLSNYLRKPKREGDDPVLSFGKRDALREALTRSGLLQLIERLGKVAGIKAMKVSPHVFRHSAAIQLLRNGCDVYSLMSLMGHTSLTVCQTYLKLSKSDLETISKVFSGGRSPARKSSQRNGR
jgi:hypothetical protein